ncbi:MAG: histidinol dehydrogenase [Candidatus Thermofonsia Clade 1 bacterium]|uniref:histidinol dehydrogenase n=1 Tax=Candidatus Thermofonsia Clade 1 bacterium TaxID=2364210 RepID=A0A2M8PB57_9CHLR|nr:MAG: histidinol dehydrogenase [Candidatus Thermofonsia Clade 1 bacterium]
MIQVRDLATLAPEELRLIMRRAEQDITALLPQAQQVIEAVRERGDAALVEYVRQFDAKEYTAEHLRVSDADFDRAYAEVGAEVVEAIRHAHANIQRFHAEQMPEPMWFMEVERGVMAGEKITPVASAGLYVPRGKGAFPSVMLMLTVPAKVAGVPRIVVVTPPNPQGKADPAALVAADIAGVREVYAVGGMAAVAGLAFGTQTLPRVSKIVGPGSSYVSAAKRLLYGVVDVGLPAGPSESIILCDETADPRLAALDLLVEAEHGAESAALLVTHSRAVADEALRLLPIYIAELPEWRRKFVENVLSLYGGIILTRNLEESIAFVNDYAPEHLEVLTADPFSTLNRIQNAGEILLGSYTPIPTSNYTLGLNAILPTGGFARSFSSVSVWDFLKRSGIGYCNREGFERLAETTVRLADYEDFPAHAMALRKRRAFWSV